MPTFKLHIRTDNTAFDDENLRLELAALLRDVADRIESGEDISLYRTIFDVNGNDVGRFALKEEN